MIADVSAALRALYSPLVPQLCFGPAPLPDHAGPVLCVFLAAVREDTRATPADWADVRDDDGRVRARQAPVRRFDLTYLLTAWAADPTAEYELLDRVLAATAPVQRLDPALFDGPLRDATVSVRLAPDAAREYAELGLPARTVLGVTANAPLLLAPDTDLAPPAAEIALGVRRGAAAGGTGNRPVNAANRRWRAARIHEQPGGDGAGRGETG